MTNQYKALVSTILTTGVSQQCRNGSQLIIPHYAFTLDFRVDSYKLLLRKMFYKGILGEFNTLISPYPLTNVGQFEANGCNYWKKWAEHDGRLNLDYYNQMHPQLEDIMKAVKTDPDSRRHVISLWNHENVQNGSLSLPCCWYSMIFTVIDGVLHMQWIQRSVDTMVGLPSDIYLAYKFMKHVANYAGLTVGTCQFALSNVHIYSEHIEDAGKLLTRTERDFEKPLKFLLKG